MALTTYKCQLDKTDRIFNPSATFIGGVRVRPGEKVEVDLAIQVHDDNFNQAKYDTIGETAHKFPFE